VSTYAFVVPGQPVAKGRPRFARTAAGVRAFTDSETMRFESLVAYAARAAKLPRLAENAIIRLEFDAIFERPKRLLRRADPRGLIRHTTKPDLDNIAKALLDGLSAHFRDQQVAEIGASKWFAERSGQPRTEVRVISIGGD
jgi:Holliday junction resolvase RusA-like endonuclease